MLQDNLFSYQTKINKNQRRNRLKQHSFVIWFTGFSGSGKSTLANALEDYLHQENYCSYILDGDNIRSGLNSDLDFSDEGRHENIRRISESAKLFVDAGLIVITAFISPFEKERMLCKSLLDNHEFVEIFIDCPIEICEQRDTKGLYKKARAGLIKSFTGIDSPYEPPSNPDIVIKSHEYSVQESINQIVTYLKEKSFI